MGDGRTALKFAANRYIAVGKSVVERVNPINLVSDTADGRVSRWARPARAI